MLNIYYIEYYVENNMFVVNISVVKYYFENNKNRAFCISNGARTQKWSEAGHAKGVIWWICRK